HTYVLPAVYHQACEIEKPRKIAPGFQTVGNNLNAMPGEHAASRLLRQPARRRDDDQVVDVTRVQRSTLLPGGVNPLGGQLRLLVRSRTRSIAPADELLAIVAVSATPGEAPHIVQRPDDRCELQADLDQARSPSPWGGAVQVVNVDDVGTSQRQQMSQ